jgi:hypothetical protein
MKILFTLAVLATVVQTCDGCAASTCPIPKPCLKFTAEKVKETCGEDCAFKICMGIQQGGHCKKYGEDLDEPELRIATITCFD